MGTIKISEKEKELLRNKARKEMERLELVFEADTTVQLLNQFKNKFNICETVYKVILFEHQKRKGRKTDSYLQITMSQVPHALKFAGYDFDKALLNELFGARSNNGKTVKKLRDEVTHGINQKAVEEIVDRKDELFDYMYCFLSKIRCFDMTTV